MSTVAYQLVRRPRRKRASLVVHPDNRIEVLAPLDMPVSHIDEWVQSKQQWIERRKQFNSRHRTHLEPKTFTHGESFDLLGKPYNLQLQTGCDYHIEVKSDALMYQGPRTDAASVKQQLTSWYQDYARQYIRQRSDDFRQQTGLSASLVDIKAYRSRWGTCHHDGRIYLNWRLIMAPPLIIDYVLVHELAHLKHHNHSPAFWQLVQRIMPDCNKARQWLKLHGHMLDI